MLNRRFLNIAHRGGGRLAPEETLVAYHNAVVLGADMLEMDLHATLDGVVVLNHDDTVDRTTNGTGRIQDMPFDEIRALDAGFAFSPDGGSTHPFRGKGVTIATFREVMQEFPDMFFSVEIKQEKPSIVDAVLSVLDETSMSDHVILVSFHDEIVQEIRERRPDIVTGAGAVEMAEFYLNSTTEAGGYTPPCPFFQLPNVDPVLMKAAHALGVKVQVWTINDEQEMRTLLKMNVDGIMTDDPGLLAKVIDGRRASAFR
ncbi:MAG: glycerophosphodiester phosphodiesterase [Deltaproteobacteria bacterium]|nr:glycerophosphodiester phosphodiesterase [Deltaproteobacteria bacterium]